MNTHTRAKKGGEFGANGEWYEGGKFIATTDRAKKKGQSKKATGKQEISPFTWETPPSEGMRSIYSKWSGFWTKSANGLMQVNPNINSDYYGADLIAEAESWAEKYNNGHRWH